MLLIALVPKLLIETALAAVALAIWQYVSDGELAMDGPFASLAMAWYIVVIGIIFTGYLLFQVALAAVCGFVASLGTRAKAASIYLLCLASVAYIGVALLLGGLDDGTVPIALGLGVGNAVFLASRVARTRS